MKYVIAFAISFTFLSLKTSAQTKITAADASKHIGETVTINDEVYSGKMIAPTNMILLHIGGAYPNELLTVVIPGKSINKFKGMIVVGYKKMSIIVTGKLVKHKGKPEIIVEDPSELKISPDDPVDAN